MLRLTGEVVKVSRRSGEKINADTGEVRPWAFDLITVLVAKQSIEECTRFDGCAAPLPRPGDGVDWAIESRTRGSRVSNNLKDVWSAVQGGIQMPALAAATAGK